MANSQRRHHPLPRPRRSVRAGHRATPSTTHPSPASAPPPPPSPSPSERHDRHPATRPTDYQVTARQGTDYYRVFDDVPAVDRAIWERAQGFVDEAAPRMAAAWDSATYPLDLVHRLGELDLLTDGVVHPQLSAVSPLAAGLINMEISRGDGSLGTVIAVQAGLALRTLALHGSPEQQERWITPLARGEVLGAFALTEPDHGSDSVALETSARRDPDGWILRGAKKWIGNGASGGITFVWARVDDPDADDHGKVRCFLVPQDTPGYRGEVIARKASLRAIHQATIILDDVHLPSRRRPARSSDLQGRRHRAARHPRRSRLVGPGPRHRLLRGCPLAYAKQRRQFGQPLAGFQLIQERLTQMLAELTSMQLHCRRIADLDAAGALAPTQASLAKYHNTRAARRVAVHRPRPAGRQRHSAWTTASPSTWRTLNPSTPTKAQNRFRPSSSDATLPASAPSPDRCRCQLPAEPPPGCTAPSTPSWCRRTRGGRRPWTVYDADEYRKITTAELPTCLPAIDVLEQCRTEFLSLRRDLVGRADQRDLRNHITGPIKHCGGESRASATMQDVAGDSGRANLLKLGQKLLDQGVVIRSPQISHPLRF